MTEETKNGPTRRETWIRALFVILFALIYGVAEVVLVMVVFIQFGFVLVAGERNQKLLDFGASLSTFVFQILRYVTFNSDDKPFPFSDWPATG